MMYLRPDFPLPRRDTDPFEAVLALQGEEIRNMDGRRTLRFILDGRGYFLKAHSGVGWREIFKNLSQLRLPVVSARNEWRAIQRLKQLGIETTPLVGYGMRGINPARRQSFVITEALENTITLEAFCKPWDIAPPRDREGIRFKRALIAKLAFIARVLHENGINHRDFYLCHFRLPLAPDGTTPLPPPSLYLMDLHRAQIRRRTPRRWQVKDLGSLYFSAMHLSLTKRDLLRFIKHYRNRSLRAVMQNENRFWQTVRRRAQRLYRRILRQRRKRGDKYLKTIFRDGNTFVCRQSLRRHTVYHRNQASPALETLLADPDASLDHPETQILKADATSTVWMVPAGEHRLVIKRYNIKNYRHAINRACRRTRAAISWKNAHRLQFYGIPTPAPVALIEERFGPLRRRAYFITEAVDGEICRDFFKEDRTDTPEAKAMVRAVSDLLRRLANLNISHGDMKASNILLGQNGPAIIDLDALREHRWKWLFRRAQQRDVRRFQKNWCNRPRLKRLFEQALAELSLRDESK